MNGTHPFPQKAGIGTFVSALIVVALASVAAAQDTLTVEHQGVPRSYIVANGQAAKAGPQPLMLVLHGRRAADEPNRTSPPLDALAARESFVAVYPAALQGTWRYPTQTGSDVPISKAGDEPADDIGFLLRVIDVLIARGIADAGRIYVSGASMGGMMTYALMCNASERIAAAAPLIANMTDLQIKACRPVRAVPAVFIAGMEDQIMPYYGRERVDFRLTSIPETTSFWAGLHRCTGQTDRFLSNVGNWLLSGGIATVQVDWTGCRLDGALRLYRVDGGGHTLPSRQPISEEARKRYGDRSTEFETSEVVWAFFKRFAIR